MNIRCAGDQDLLSLLTLRASWRGVAVTDDYAVGFSAWFERESSQRWWWLAEDTTGVAVGMVNMKIFDRMPVPGGSSGRWGATWPTSLWSLLTGTLA